MRKWGFLSEQFVRILHLNCLIEECFALDIKDKCGNILYANNYTGKSPSSYGSLYCVY